jgi:hypothetical protein
MAGLKIRKSRKQNIANRFHSEIRWVSVVDIAALLGKHRERLGARWMDSPSSDE